MFFTRTFYTSRTETEFLSNITIYRTNHCIPVTFSVTFVLLKTRRDRLRLHHLPARSQNNIQKQNLPNN